MIRDDKDKKIHEFLLKDKFKKIIIFVGILGIGSSIYCGIKCAKITNYQMEQISDMTADKLICKLGLDKSCEENKEWQLKQNK